MELNTEPSAFRSLARECKNGRLRAAFVAPHVSQESVVFEALERLRASKGLRLVECGRSFLSWPRMKLSHQLRPFVD